MLRNFIVRLFKIIGIAAIFLITLPWIIYAMAIIPAGLYLLVTGKS